MGNHVACCGNGPVAEPEATAPPTQQEPLEEDQVILSSKGLIEDEPASKDLEELPSPTSAAKREQFRGRAVSSFSLQGIQVDEQEIGKEGKEGKAEKGMRSNTSQSMGATKSMTSTKSFVEMISDFFGGVKRPDFNGEWVCIATWGLEEFLKEMGIGYMKRLAASKAPWLSWEFKQEKDNIRFCNHTMLGDIVEEFTANGSSYSTVDGHKQTLTCTASWEGSTLVILRSGPQGRFREERSIDEMGHLNFKLIGLEDGFSAVWGRTFKRKGS